MDKIQRKAVAQVTRGGKKKTKTTLPPTRQKTPDPILTAIPISKPVYSFMDEEEDINDLLASHQGTKRKRTESDTIEHSAGLA